VVEVNFTGRAKAGRKKKMKSENEGKKRHNTGF